MKNYQKTSNSQMTVEQFNDIYSKVEKVTRCGTERILEILVSTGVIEKFKSFRDYYVVSTYCGMIFKSSGISEFEETDALDQKRMQLAELENEIREICENDNVSFHAKFLDNYINFTDHGWNSSY